MFDKCTEVTSFSETFSECTILTTIPEGLFGNCTKVTDFSGVFEFTNIIKVPANTFATEVVEPDFTQAFFNSKITIVKSGAFNCPNMTRLKQTFLNSSLITIEENAFNCPKVTDFYETFSGCLSLQTISKEAFEKCTEVTNFRRTFQGCTSLQTIPEGLFDYNELSRGVQ